MLLAWPVRCLYTAVFRRPRESQESVDVETNVNFTSSNNNDNDYDIEMGGGGGSGGGEATLYYNVHGPSVNGEDAPIQLSNIDSSATSTSTLHMNREHTSSIERSIEHTT